MRPARHALALLLVAGLGLAGCTSEPQIPDDVASAAARKLADDNAPEPNADGTWIPEAHGELAAGIGEKIVTTAGLNDTSPRDVAIIESVWRHDGDDSWSMTWTDQYPDTGQATLAFDNVEACLTVPETTDGEPSVEAGPCRQ